MKQLKRTLVMIMMSLTLVLGTTMVISAMNPVIVQASTKTDLQTKANAIIKNTTKTDDTKTAKLKKLFTYMRKNYVYGNCSKHPNYKPPVSGNTTWTYTYALETLKSKKGDCYHFAAAYACLAEKATGYKTRVVTGKTVGFDAKRTKLQPHAWVEVYISGKWYVYDVNLDLYGKTTSGGKVAAYTYCKKDRATSAMKKIYNSYKGIINFSVNL